MVDRAALGDRELSDIAAGLLRAGMIAIPLCANSKQIAYRAMGLPPYHVFVRRKRFMNLAFQSLAFYLALRPPGERRIRDWFSGHEGNIGVITGYRGLIVLDFDDAAAYGKWAARHGDALKTPAARSPTGYHVYLRCPTPIDSSSLYFGGRKAGHIKGYGGYVACSPSTIADAGDYGWLEGRSPVDVEPATVTSLAAMSIQSRGPFRRAYDRLLSRGAYDPDETVNRDEVMAWQGLE